MIATLLLVVATIPCQAEEPPIRKAVSSGICHDPSSPNYNQIKAYVSYATMAACVASGGRPRKGSVEATAPAKRAGRALYDSDDATIVKKSRANICYDASSGRFTEIIHFTAYRDMEDCVADGGRDAAH